jgi:small subunit ribosomal protein S4
MANTDNKCKQCRRLGEKLFLKGERCLGPNCAMVKRNYPPGFHGAKRQKRQSNYGLQLAAKQKAKKMYGLKEKQFRNNFTKAQKKTGDTGKTFLRSLEMRLDNVVYRLGLGSSRAQARQLVNHAHFTLNGKKASIPSMLVKEGDTIQVRAKSQKSPYFRNNIEEKLKKNSLPSWLTFDGKDLSAKVLHEPKDADLPQEINVQVIIEFYSK